MLPGRTSGSTLSCQAKNQSQGIVRRMSGFRFDLLKLQCLHTFTRYTFLPCNALFARDPMFEQVCLLLDAIGLCSAAWLLALIHKQLVGFQIDEVYIGKPSDRAAAEKAVDEELAQE